MQHFHQQIPSFAKKLAAIRAAEITTHAYASAYLQTLQTHAVHYLHMYALVLQKAFAQSSTTMADARLLDYGCGNGLLAIFAKYCGVHTVIGIDLQPDFLNAAQMLSEQLDIHVDAWLLGTEAQLQQVQPSIDILVATDVIEHVYNLSNMLQQLQKHNAAMVAVFTTASIAENYFKSKQLQALQRKDEWQGSNALHSNYQDSNTGLPFLRIRQRIIEQHFPTLGKSTVEQLAQQTRGLQQADIIVAVHQFMETGILPLPDTHPTNTCDPITGSWTERLLPIPYYQQLFANHGWQLHISFGFYNQFEGGLKCKLAAWANQLIQHTGKWAKYISPFMVLTAVPQQKQQ